MGGGLHPYTECSSKGTCDRTTGECQCYPGYEGRGCRRHACPNNCSGNGRCISNTEVNSEYVATAGAKFSSSTWDMEGARVCACDRGYEGYDCSSRICPKGDDPVTDCSTGGQADANSLAHHMVQRLYVEVTQNGRDICTHVTKKSGAEYTNYKTTTTTTDSDFNSLVLGPVTPKHIADYGLLADTTGTAFFAKRHDESTQGKACTRDSSDDPPINLDTFVGTYYGYIALKYTDMFGGEYFTRPILIDTSEYAKQSYDDASGTNSSPYGAINRLFQYEASKDQFYAVDGEYNNPGASGATQSEGDLLNGAASANTHEPIWNNRMLRTTLKRFTADRIRHALQDLPNFAVPSVNVTNYIAPGSTSNDDIWGNVFDITFTDSATAGKQPMLECVYDSARSCAGAQPKMANLDPYGPTVNGLGATDKIRTQKASPLAPQAKTTRRMRNAPTVVSATAPRASATVSQATLARTALHRPFSFKRFLPSCACTATGRKKAVRAVLRGRERVNGRGYGMIDEKWHGF